MVESSQAQSRRPRTLISRNNAVAIECPAVIGLGGDSAFFQRSKDSKKFPVECFQNARQAQKAGYISTESQKKLPVTGWWRVPVDLVKNTCKDENIANKRVNFFVQMRQVGTDVFGEICPLNLHFVGKRVNDGVTLVASQTVNDTAFCPGGAVEVSYFIEFDRMREKGNDLSRYHKVKRCTAPNTAVSSCSQTWEGIALRETAHPFPLVPNDINQFAGTCAQTLEQCSDCHSGE